MLRYGNEAEEDRSSFTSSDYIVAGPTAIFIIRAAVRRPGRLAVAAPNLKPI